MLRLGFALMLAMCATVALFLAMGHIANSSSQPPARELTPVAQMPEQAVFAQEERFGDPGALEKPEQDDLFDAQQAYGDPSNGATPRTAAETPETTIEPAQILPPPRTARMGDPMPPTYPRACLREKAEGTVVFRFDVTSSGETANVRILSSPNRCFDRPVMKWVSGWKYPPGAPQSDVTDQIGFRLQK